MDKRKKLLGITGPITQVNLDRIYYDYDWQLLTVAYMDAIQSLDPNADRLTDPKWQNFNEILDEISNHPHMKLHSTKSPAEIRSEFFKKALIKIKEG